MIDVGVPRYIVPSAVLGIPGEPEYVGESEPGGGWPTDTSGYRFNASNGDTATVSMTIVAPDDSVLAGHSVWEAQVTFLWVPAAQQTVDWKLTVEVNSTSAGGVDLDDEEVKEVHFTRLDGSAGWDSTTDYANAVDISLVLNEDTRLDTDRIVYVWAVRVDYVDTSTGALLWRSEFHNMTDNATTDYSSSGDPGSELLATDNLSWLITDSLDGVEITHSIDAGDFDSVDEEAFAVMMEQACGSLHDDYSPPTRCLVEERASANARDVNTGATAYSLGYFDPPEMLSRMELGDRWGDGVMATMLPWDIENVGAEQGRFAGKETIDAGEDLMLYEPRLTVSLTGEVHTWTLVIPAYAASNCEDTWTISWDVTAESTASNPLFHWYVQQLDSGGSVIDQADDFVDADESGDHDFAPVYLGQSFVVWWVNLGGGASTEDSNNVQFAIDPPAGCSSLSWDPASNWVHDTSLSEPMVESAYGCVVGYFDGASTPCP